MYEGVGFICMRGYDNRLFKDQSATVSHRDIFIGGAGGALPPLNFDNPKRSRIWEAYVVVRLAAT